MKSLFLLVLSSVLCIPVLGQKDKSKEEEKPVSIIVSASIEAIRAELTRAHLNAGYILCNESPSRLTFCEEPKKPKRPYVDRRERSFTFIQTGASTEVIASEIMARLTLGGRFEATQKDKATRNELQKVLDNLKRAAETSSPSS